jgi:hypothetical protein
MNSWHPLSPERLPSDPQLEQADGGWNCNDDKKDDFEHAADGFSGFWSEVLDHGVISFLVKFLKNTQEKWTCRRWHFTVLVCPACPKGRLASGMTTTTACPNDVEPVSSCSKLGYGMRPANMAGNSIFVEGGFPDQLSKCFLKNTQEKKTDTSCACWQQRSAMLTYPRSRFDQCDEKLSCP